MLKKKISTTRIVDGEGDPVTSKRGLNESSFNMGISNQHNNYINEFNTIFPMLHTVYYCRETEERLTKFTNNFQLLFDIIHKKCLLTLCWKCSVKHSRNVYSASPQKHILTRHTYAERQYRLLTITFCLQFFRLAR